MADFWSIGPAAAALSLRALGFSPPVAERLVMLKIRYERGAFSQPTFQEKRLRFLRWLVQHGHLAEAVPNAAADPNPDCDEGNPPAGRRRA